MARLMTSCWICSVPSKMSWPTLPRFLGGGACCSVRLTRGFAIGVSAECCSVRPVLGMTRAGSAADAFEETPCPSTDSCSTDQCDEQADSSEQEDAKPNRDRDHAEAADGLRLDPSLPAPPRFGRSTHDQPEPDRERAKHAEE